MKKKGSKFGCFPEPSKSFLVVDVEHVSEAEEVFSGLGINIVCSHRLLGGITGSFPGNTEFVEGLVKNWHGSLN